MTRYLTKKEHDIFDSFLKKRSIRRVEVARILGLKTGSSITQYFDNLTFKRNDFEKVREVLKERALEGFEALEFGDLTGEKK